MMRRSASQGGWRVAAAALLSASALGAGLPGTAAAAQIGATGATINCGFPAAAADTSCVVPAAGGQITSFSLASIPGEAGEIIDFLVLRPAGSNYTVVGRTGQVTLAGTGLETFPAGIPVHAGDILGIWWATHLIKCLRPGPSPSVLLSPSAAEPSQGDALSFSNLQSADLNESATLGPLCTVTLTSRVAGPLTVLPGQTVCLNNGATIGGSVIVKPGGTLILNSANVSGSIVSDGAQSVVVCGSTVGGSVSIRNTIGPFQFGDNVDGCTPNRVSGAVSLKDNPPR